MLVLNTKDWEKIGQYSGNPFLDAMVDMQDVFSTISTYQQYKPYIDKYTDTSLSDLKDKVKAYIPEAINQDGGINFSKLEELASNGNPLAEHIITIKQHRENFANAPIGGKIDAIKNDAIRDIISGNKLTKEATILKKSQQFDEYLKKAKNIPEEWKPLISLNKEAFLNDPKSLAVLFSIFGNQQTTQDNSPQSTTTEINNNSPQSTTTEINNNSSQSTTTEINNNSSQSPTIEQFINNPFKPLDYINTTTEDNTSSQTPTSEADYIKSIIENNLQKLPPQKRKQVIHKLKQAVETKKKQTQKTNKQTQKTNKNNQSDIDINNPLKPLGDVSLQSQQQTSSTQPKPKKAKSTDNTTVPKIFKNAVYNSSSPNPNMFKPVGNIIKHITPPQPYIHPYIPSILDDSVLGKVLKRIFNSD